VSLLQSKPSQLPLFQQTPIKSNASIWLSSALEGKLSDDCPSFDLLIIVMYLFAYIILSNCTYLRTFTSLQASDTIRGMGKAGKALRQVLGKHGSSQNRLAVTMGLARSTVNQWFNEITDPSAESVTQIVAALEQLNESAAKEFIALYLGRIALEDTPPEQPED
jgi:DNA-binding XRE family transcriptional regulator